MKLKMNKKALLARENNLLKEIIKITGEEKELIERKIKLIEEERKLIFGQE